MISIKSFIEKNKAKKLTLDYIRNNHPSDIVEATYQFNGKYRVPIEYKGDKNLALVKYFDKGKIKGFYIPENIAESLNTRTAKEINVIVGVIGWFGSHLFMPAFISLNLGFQIYNFQRDFKRTRKILNMGRLKLASYYLKAWNPSISRGFSIKNALISDMYSKKMLSTPFNDILKGDPNDVDSTEILKNIGYATICAGFVFVVLIFVYELGTFQS
jgi:hypothetical protein